MGTAPMTTGTEHGSELSSAQQMVLNMFAGCTANEGLNIDTACRSLKSKLREEETRQVHSWIHEQIQGGMGSFIFMIRVIIDWLIDEGHLYSTIDDNHAKSTSG